MKIKLFLTISILLTTIGVEAQICNMVVSNNRRIQVKSMDAPYCYISHMVMHRGSSYNGTGFLIHPRVMLTAGHNVRKRPLIFFTPVKSITLRLGSNSEQTNLYKRDLITIQDSNIYANHDFNRNYDLLMDFGVVILPDEEMYKKAGGYFRLIPTDSSKLSGRQIFLSGYPADRPEFTQWTDFTTGYSFTNGVLKYDIHTDHGASGAPVWYTEGNKFNVFAIHTSGTNNKSCNSATLITPKIYQEIKDFCMTRGIDIGAQGM